MIVSYRTCVAVILSRESDCLLSIFAANLTCKEYRSWGKVGIKKVSLVPRKGKNQKGLSCA